MKEANELIRVYVGTEVLANLLKAELEDIGVGAIVQNDYLSGISVGFMGGTPSSVELYIQESELKEAESVIHEFIQVNN
jgi:hypothetical protein